MLMAFTLKERAARLRKEGVCGYCCAWAERGMEFMHFCNPDNVWRDRNRYNYRYRAPATPFKFY